MCTPGSTNLHPVSSFMAPPTTPHIPQLVPSKPNPPLRTFPKNDPLSQHQRKLLHPKVPHHLHSFTGTQPATQLHRLLHRLLHKAPGQTAPNWKRHRDTTRVFGKLSRMVQGLIARRKRP